MEYIYADELTDVNDADAWKAARDAYMGTSYTAEAREAMGYDSWVAWRHLDRQFNRAAVEKHCRVISGYGHTNDHTKMRFIFMANGYPVLVRDKMPSEEQISARYVEFLKWQGCGFPFPMYFFVYMPIEAPPPSPVLRRSARLAGADKVDYSGMA